MYTQINNEKIKLNFHEGIKVFVEGPEIYYLVEINEYKKMVDEKETLVLKLTDDERSRLLERTKYLQEQRDKYVEELINKK